MNKSEIIIKKLIQESERLTANNRVYYKQLVKSFLSSVSDNDLEAASARHIDTYSTALKERSHNAVGSYFRGIDSVQKLRSHIINRMLPMFDLDIVSYKTGPDNIAFESTIRNASSIKFLSQYSRLTTEQGNKVLNLNDEVLEATNNTISVTTKTQNHARGPANVTTFDLLYIKAYAIPYLKDFNSSLYRRVLYFMRSILDESSNMEDDGPEYIEEVPATIVVSAKESDIKLVSIFPFFKREVADAIKVKNWNAHANSLLKLIDSLIPKKRT